MKNKDYDAMMKKVVMIGNKLLKYKEVIFKYINPVGLELILIALVLTLLDIINNTYFFTFLQIPQMIVICAWGWIVINFFIQVRYNIDEIVSNVWRKLNEKYKE